MYKDKIIKEFREKFCFNNFDGKKHYQSLRTNLDQTREIEQWLSKKIDEVVEAVQEVDFSIDVRYEENVLVAFDKFIQKWCGSHAGHLLDSDEQDGQFMREKIRSISETKEEC